MDKKQQHIIQAAKQLFDVKGVNGTSLQEIIEHADISKGTFYKYFPSKDEFIGVIIAQLYEAIHHEIEALLIGQSYDDEAIFKQQLTLYLAKMNDYHLYDLVRVIRQGQNFEQRKFIFEQEERDMQWMARRLLETRAPAIGPLAVEAMALYYGMLKTVFITSRHQDIPVDYEHVIELTWRYLLRIIEEMTITQQSLYSRAMAIQTPIQLIKDAIATATGDEADLLQALLEELTQAKPRPVVIKSLATALGSNYQAIQDALS